MSVTDSEYEHIIAVQHTTIDDLRAEIERLKAALHHLAVFAGWCNSPSFDIGELHERARAALEGK